MKKQFLIGLILLPFISFSQQVENIKASQLDEKIQITYDLVNTNQWQNFSITAYCSDNGGASFPITLQSTTGDIGDNVKGGKNKSITWDVLKDLSKLQSDNIRFKIKATVTEDLTKAFNYHLFIADSTYEAGNFEVAKKQYLKAQEIKDTQYIEEQIKYCNIGLKYIEMIAEADKLYQQEYYQQARQKYLEAENYINRELYDEKTDKEERTTIIIKYLGDTYGCNLNLIIQIGDVEFTPTSNTFNISNIPAGNQQYEVSGLINCGPYGTCAVVGTGTIFVSEGTEYHVLWHHAAQGRCTVTLTTDPTSY